MTDLVSLPREPSSDTANQDALAQRVAMSSEPSAQWHFLKSLIHEPSNLQPNMASASAASVNQSVIEHADLMEFVAQTQVAASLFQQDYSLDHTNQVDHASALAYVPIFDHGWLI